MEVAVTTVQCASDDHNSDRPLPDCKRAANWKGSRRFLYKPNVYSHTPNNRVRNGVAMVTLLNNHSISSSNVSSFYNFN